MSYFQFNLHTTPSRQTDLNISSNHSIPASKFSETPSDELSDRPHPIQSRKIEEFSGPESYEKQPAFNLHSSIDLDDELSPFSEPTESDRENSDSTDHSDSSEKSSASSDSEILFGEIDTNYPLRKKITQYFEALENDNENQETKNLEESLQKKTTSDPDLKKQLWQIKFNYHYRLLNEAYESKDTNALNEQILYFQTLPTCKMYFALDEISKERCKMIHEEMSKSSPNQ